MRKGEILSAILLRDAVALRILALGKEQIPRTAGVLLRTVACVEALHPGGKRIRVVAARGETAVGRVPEDVLLCAAHGQDGTAILSRHRERARPSVGDAHPIDERGATETIRRRRGAAAANQRS